MEILFAGICLWDTLHKQPDLIGLMPNGRNGLTTSGQQVPPHTAVIMVPPNAVNLDDWNEVPQRMTVAGDEHLVFRLRGDDITFEPAPNGGAPSLMGIPKVGCATGKRVRGNLAGATPPASDVAARIHLPGNAALVPLKNQFDSFVTRLDVAATTRLVSQPFGGARRSLTFNGNPTVIIANIDLDLAVSSAGNDDGHARLYCPLFEPVPDEEGVAVNAESNEVESVFLDGLLFSSEAVADDAGMEYLEAVSSLASEFDSSKAIDPKTRRGFGGKAPSNAARVAGGLTLGPGCSNSQWP